MYQRQEQAKTHAGWGRLVPQYAGRIVNAAEFVHIPDDGNHYELVDGKVIQMPPPRRAHGMIQGFIMTLLNLYLWQAGIGGSVRSETGYLLSAPGQADLILGPDVSYLAAEHEVDIADDEAYERVAPDWVIEIASPSQSRKDLTQKVYTYLAAGVRLVWFVWPAPQFIEVWYGDDIQAKAQRGERVQSHIFSATETITGMPVLPDFACSLEEIFEGRGSTQSPL